MQIKHLDPTQRRAAPAPGAHQALAAYSEQGGFADGDVVTRDGTDHHTVRNMTPDGLCAEFVCIKAPRAGWTEVGEVEYNLCRRYTRVNPPPCREVIDI